MGKDIFIGLDVGTDSVGYAVTDTEYNLIKHNGEPMWGSTVFEAAKTKAERRGFRTARRRLDRRQQRVALTQEIFAKEIANVDDKFFIRIKESALYRKDTSFQSDYFLFQDDTYTDKEYHIDYPTIHHLIQELMTDTTPKDVRLVYLAIAWFMAHRGHFLNEVDKKNISQVTDFDCVYDKFEEYCLENFESTLWNCDRAVFRNVMLMKASISRKEKAFYEILNNGIKFKDNADDAVSKAGVIKLLAGGTLKPDKLFLNSEYSEMDSVSLGMLEENFAMIIAELGDDGEFLLKLRELYDWALLADILGGYKGDADKEISISDVKVKVYEQHQKDLLMLKKIVKKYIPEKYALIFRNKDLENYAAYSGHNTNKKCNKEVFSEFLKKQLKDIEVSEEDDALYKGMMERIETHQFLPKQVDGDNRVIPYQLYWHELNRILENAKGYLSFLEEKDESGYTNADKLLSIFEFRIPYYVGPLRTDNSLNAWMKRKEGSVGKIYPWNFEDMVDLDASEQEFINRMTNTCSYLPGEDVIPKCSLLYSKFMVLNEINNIKVNDVKIPVEIKWQIFDKFKEYKKVTPKKIEEVLISNGCMQKGDILSGLDVTVKSSLASYHIFKTMLNNGILSEEEAEEIIRYFTYSEDKARLKSWLDTKYSKLSEADRKYILKQKFKDFGRLSKKFLVGITGIKKETGEVMTVMEALWNNNDNLMQILSERYTFSEVIESERQDYYDTNGKNSIENILDDMYISNSVKRPIYRTLAILDDVRKATKTSPKRIFIEMARGGGEKGKRTKSRRDQIKDLYANFNKQEVRELSKLLDDKSDNELQSEVLFLYFMQMGQCMYSGEHIDIEELKSSKYNVDHIYPQSKVKDDSITNKVLVLSTLNSEKGNGLVPSSYRTRMASTWKQLRDKNMMSEEKYKRLMRNVPFTEEELQGFINRQLVETRQSTKALASVLQRLYPDTEIVYVKAGLVSDFRHEFDILKSRKVNDLHHGKDAYLNIVCGNVYHCRFTKNFSFNKEYSLKVKTIFTQTVYENKCQVWKGQEDIGRIIKTVSKNNLHYTRFAFERKGGLFDQNPLKKGNGTVPRKANLLIKDYGGYNKPTASFFLAVKYLYKNKQDIMFMPVDLLAAEQIAKNESNAISYAQKNIAGILGKDESAIEIISLPLGLRKIKINTVFSLDGFKVSLSGKSNGGSYISVSSMEALKIGTVQEKYIKKLERFMEKKQKKIIDKIDEKYDEINGPDNLKLYDTFIEKLQSNKYQVIMSNHKESLIESREHFIKMSLEEQIVLLMNILGIFQAGATKYDLREIGESKNTSAIPPLSSNISNWKKKYKDVRIVDISASGIFETSTCNLLELL